MSFYEKILSYIKLNGINSILPMFDFMTTELIKNRFVRFLNIILLLILFIIYLNYCNNLPINVNLLLLAIMLFILTLNIYHIMVINTYLYIVNSYKSDYLKTLDSIFYNKVTREEKIAYITLTMFKAISLKARVNRFNLFKIVKTNDSLELKHIL